MTITEEKRLLRKYIKQKKQELSFEEKCCISDTIFAKVEELPQFKNAKKILAYWAMTDEVQTQNFILRWQNKKQFVLPVVVGDDLELREFTGINELKVSDNYGIFEPHTGKIVEPNELDLIIVPGVAFDMQGNRLGRGKAYYDKLLRGFVVYKVAVCFALQIVEQVPVEKLDIQMDKVVWD